MRILLVSDLHYRLRQLDWLVDVAADHDLVVIAGDLLDIASIVDPGAQIAVVLEYLERIARKSLLVVSSGNHDLDGHNDLGERSARWLEGARARRVHVDGACVETDDEVVTVCAWWDGPRSRELVDDQLARDAALVAGRRWIWVYHAPPDASPTSWTGARHYGDADLVKWIEEHRPDLVLCGHVHQSPFSSAGAWVDEVGSTIVMNAGHQIGPTPTHIEIDTNAGVARWSSMEGVEERTLAFVR
jgi:Icc-related predicted phosphoesterase